MSEKITIPTSGDELAEMLADSSKVAKLMASGQFADVVKAYAASVREKDAEQRTQVKEQVQSVLSDYLRENGVKGDRVPVAANRALYNPSAAGSRVESEFGSSHEFFRTIHHNTERTPEVMAKLARVRAAYSSQDGASGGFLVPETLRSELLRISLETGVVRPRARVIPMDAPRVGFPAVDSTSNASSVHGGIIAYWTEEAGTMTDTNASFSKVVLDAGKLTLYTQVPNELLDDANAFQAFLSTAFPEALAYHEDVAFLSGSGVGEPLGVYNASGAVTVTKETGQVADTIVWENIVKMYSRMLPGSHARAVWLVPPNAFPELATMALSVGTGGSAIWLNNGVAGPPMTILGRPVVVTEKAPTVGDAGDISFVDFSYYLIGDRQQMTASSSPHFKFQNDLTAFKVISRVDGRPWLQSAITPRNSGDTLSPYVKLGARA